MACCSNPGSETKGGGSCCGGQRPFPWLSAICDPKITRLFLLRYWRELLLGAAAGGLTGWAALAFGEGLGALGPLLRGPWLHFHPAAVLAAAIPAGLILALTMAWNGARGWRAASGWALAFTALGGIGNGFLELGEAQPGGILAAFFREGGPYSVLGFVLLGLPTLWLVWGVLAAAFRVRGRRQPKGSRDRSPVRPETLAPFVSPENQPR